MSKTILICDDDEGIVDMLELLFDGTGYNVIPVTDSLQVFNVVEQRHPDLILLDLWMPVLSGDQVIKSLRNNPDTADMPIIVISASRDGEKIALDAGATDFIPKPFDMDNLLNRVDELLGAKVVS